MSNSFRRSILVTCIMTCGLTATVSAQIRTYPIAYVGPHDPSIPVQATQAWFSVFYDNERARHEAVRTVGTYDPEDSLRILAIDRAKAWITSLQSQSVTGLQLDPYGMIGVAAGEEELAQRQIAARLATLKLSSADSAFTLMTAVSAFSNPEYPKRIPIAERYLAQLTTLGSNAALYEFVARRDLIHTYYRLGRSDEVARVGMRAFGLAVSMPFDLRGELYLRSQLAYGEVLDALGSQPDGPRKIQALIDTLQAGTHPSPGLVAYDSAFYWIGKSFANATKSLVSVAERVGQQGPPVTAQYWVNRGATRDSQSIAVNDGRIRIIEVGHFTCAPCAAAVAGLNRLQPKYPKADFIFLTWTMGCWGNRLIDPHTESERVADHFLNNLKAKISIGIAYTSRDTTDEGVMNQRVLTDTWKQGHYPQASKPTFYILDGAGRIRHVMLGYDRDLEENLSHIIEFIQRETHPGQTT